MINVIHGFTQSLIYYFVEIQFPNFAIKIGSDQPQHQVPHNDFTF